MRKSDAVTRYGTHAKAAAALGVAPSTFCEFGEVIPLPYAAILALADKRLRSKLDLTLYDKLPPCLEARR